jgi:hypothetical protein
MVVASHVRCEAKRPQPVSMRVKKNMSGRMGFCISKAFLPDFCFLVFSFALVSPFSINRIGAQRVILWSFLFVMNLFSAVTFFLLSNVWVVGHATGLKVVILYPLIPASELSFLTDVVCNTNPAYANFTALIPHSHIPGFPTRCFHEVIRTSVFSEPERFQHITSSHKARTESFFQNRGDNLYIDTLAAAMEHADMVWSGPSRPLSEIYLFIDHIIEMIPLRPFVLSFSQALVGEEELDAFDYSNLFSLILRSSGFATYDKKYKFDISPTVQCMANNPSGGCRDMLPAETSAFVTELVTATRQSLHDYKTTVDSMCHKNNPDVFGEEGMSVINALRQGTSSTEENAPAEGVRVMCFTYSYEVKHANVEAIRKTWGKRCDGYLAISNVSKQEDGIFALGTLILVNMN